MQLSRCDDFFAICHKNCDTKSSAVNKNVTTVTLYYIDKKKSIHFFKKSQNSMGFPSNNSEHSMTCKETSEKAGTGKETAKEFYGNVQKKKL